ncbi:hypothetical protein VB636_08905 [Paracoccus sp. APAP_BH8]|uniref:hypothetical protein n=1 Tax=Paracoccus sp. APAP_BH8 TaxID=3110237 RepID=UPI002FD7FEC3
MSGKCFALPMNRRAVLGAGCAALLPFPVHAAPPELAFNELYARIGVLGMEFSQKVLDLSGQRVRITGFMAPPLKAEADFFVLGKAPMAICPFCSSDADWPDDILVVYLRRRQTFAHLADMIVVEGVLEHGSWTDPETGFVSLLRLRDADYRRI